VDESEKTTALKFEAKRNRGARMNQSSFLSDVCFWLPDHISNPFAWVGHIPFAFWITEALRPEVLVELGTHSGNSYFAFCQAVKKLNLPTRCHAVDCWQGDEHAGFYGEEIFESVDQKNRSEYGLFSRLIRSRFDAAAPLFEPQSIDLLHIDGLHTFEAVKHDFEHWLPKMSRRGVILMHDTNVYENNFGVYLLFEEQAKRYPTFQFLHSHGLGVVGVGRELPQQLLPLFEADGDEPKRDRIRAIYERLGQAIFEQAAYADSESRRASLESELGQSRQTLTAMQRQIDALADEIGSLTKQSSILNAAKQQAEDEAAKAKQALESASQHVESLNRHIESLRDELTAHQEQLCAIQQSLGWMLLDRVRRIRDEVMDSDTTPGRCWTALTGLFKSATR
jgi:Methyltransferase domain